MTTIVNSPNPGNGDSGGTNTGVIVAVIAIVAAILIGLFFVYALPEIRRMGETNDDGGGINIPDEIKIDVGTDQGGGDQGGDQPAQ